MEPSNKPLAERVRPQQLDEVIGQEHLVGEHGVLRKAIQSGRVPSMILWGPPGVGKPLWQISLHKPLRLHFYA